MGILKQLFSRENSLNVFKKTAFTLVIRYLYLILTIFILNNIWYVGHGSYGISFNIWKDILATIVFIAISYVHFKLNSSDTLMELVLHIVYNIWYIPISCSFAINNASFGYFVQSQLYFVFIVLLFGLFGEKKTNFIAENNYKSQKQTAEIKLDKKIELFCIIICLLTIAYKFFYNGFSFSLALDAEHVYSNRAIYHAFTQSISGRPIAYLITILTNLASVVIPFYLFVSLLRKRIAPSIISVLAAICAYSISYQKATLMFVAVIIVLYFFRNVKLIIRNFKEITSLSLLLLLFICLIEYIIFKESSIYIFLVRRIMYYPAWLNNIYYDFFSETQKVFWTDNAFLLQNILPQIHVESPLTMINNFYFAGKVPSPNTGMFAEAYMHLGSLGIVVYPIFLTVLFKIYNKILSHYEKILQIFFAVMLSIWLTNVPVVWTDSVLSYILFAIILWLLPKFTFIDNWLSVIENILKKFSLKNRIKS